MSLWCEGSSVVEQGGTASKELYGSHVRFHPKKPRHVESFEYFLKFLRAIEGHSDAGGGVNAGSVRGELGDCAQGIRNGQKGTNLVTGLVGLEASLMPDRSCQDALRGVLRPSVPFRGFGVDGRPIDPSDSNPESEVSLGGMDFLG